MILTRLGVLATSLLLAGTVVVPAAPAAAEDYPPLTAVAGPGSSWQQGPDFAQPGQNCSVPPSFTEVMVSGFGMYGGPSHVPVVGDPYWTAFLVSVPGVPCGVGGSFVTTTVQLPQGTQVDPARPVRCFGLPRGVGAQWGELTGYDWSFQGASGPYCPTRPTTSPTHPGGVHVGTRPIANGQLFWIFVPVVSSNPLAGTSGPNGGDAVTWYADSTGVDSNPGTSRTPVTVLPAPAVPVPPQPAPALAADVLLSSNTELARGRLAKGQKVRLSCSVDTDVRAELVVSRSVARRLGIPGRRSQVVATGRGQCRAGTRGRVVVRLVPKQAGRLRAAERGFSARLSVTFSPAVGEAVTQRVRVRVR